MQRDDVAGNDASHIFASLTESEMELHLGQRWEATNAACRAAAAALDCKHAFETKYAHS
jgi:hypothetical protein